MIPTAVVLFITKSYFDGIFKELGKDHYGLIKNCLKTLYAGLFGTKAPISSLIGSAGKIQATSPNYSLVFSLLAEADDGLTFNRLLKYPYGKNAAIPDFV